MEEQAKQQAEASQIYTTALLFSASVQFPIEDKQHVILEVECTMYAKHRSVHCIRWTHASYISIGVRVQMYSNELIYWHSATEVLGCYS